MRRFLGGWRCRSGRAVVMRGPPARLWRHGSTAGRIALLGIVVAGSGCTRARDSGPFIAQADARINIEVRNHSYEDVTLHAIWPGKRVRLGSVNGLTDANYVIPWDVSELLQIEMDMLAGGTCTLRPIVADPGDIILLEITNQTMIDPDCLFGQDVARTPG